MSVSRSVAEVLADHVTLEVEGIDRMYLNVYVPGLQREQGVACFTSKEYDEAAAFRRSGAGEVETIMVEGGEFTK